MSLVTIVTLSASGGKRNVTVCGLASVCLSRLF